MFASSHTFTTSFDSGVVKIHAGVPQQTFVVHESIIQATSLFFKAAFTNCWLEGCEREIDMPETSAKMIHLYIDWTYTKKLKIGVPKTLYELDHVNAILVAAYIFAEQIQDNMFADNVLDVLIAASKIKIDGESAYLDSDQVALIYRSTPPSSKLRNFVQDEYIWNGRAQRMDDLARDILPVDFLFDLIVGLFIFRPAPKGKSPTKESHSCIYHKHQNDEECYKHKRVR